MSVLAEVAYGSFTPEPFGTSAALCPLLLH